MEAVVIPLATLVHLLLLATYLDVDEFAQWGLLNTMIGFGPIFSLGMGYAVFRYALQIKLTQSWVDKLKVEIAMALSLMFSAILSIVLSCFYADNLVQILNLDIPHHHVQMALFLAMFFIIINEQDILLSFALKGLDLYKKIVSVEVVSRAIWLLMAMMILLVKTENVLLWIVLNYAVVNVLRVIIKYTFFLKKGWVDSVKMQGVPGQLWVVIKDGLACLFLHVGGILAIVLDRLIFNHLFGFASFSAYFLAIQLFQSIHGLTNTIFVSFLNHYALKKSNLINFYELLSETVLCVFVYGTLAIITLIFVTWAYPQYAIYAETIFLPLMLAFMVLSLSIPANNILILLNKMNWVGSVSLLAGVVTCTASSLFFSADFTYYAYAKNLFGGVQVIFNLSLLMYLIHVNQHHSSP